MCMFVWKLALNRVTNSFKTHVRTRKPISISFAFTHQMDRNGKKEVAKLPVRPHQTY